MSDAIKHVSDATFDKDVLQSGNPVLVDFWAEWCGPCKMFAPVLDEVAKEYGGKVTIAKLDIDANPSTPGKYGIRGIPTRDPVQGRPGARAEGRRADQVAAHGVPRQQPVSASSRAAARLTAAGSRYTLPLRTACALKTPPYSLNRVGAACSSRGAAIPNRPDSRPAVTAAHGLTGAAHPARTPSHHAPIRTQSQARLRADRSRQRERDRRRQPDAQAGADVRDPEEAGQEGRADLRRRRARSAARRLRLPALARHVATSPAPTTSTSRRRRSAASTCTPATRSKARSARPRTASATSRWSRSTRSTASRPRTRSTRSCSRT